MSNLLTTCTGICRIICINKQNPIYSFSGKTLTMLNSPVSEWNIVKLKPISNFNLLMLLKQLLDDLSSDQHYAHRACCPVLKKTNSYEDDKRWKIRFKSFMGFFNTKKKQIWFMMLSQQANKHCNKCFCSCRLKDWHFFAFIKIYSSNNYLCKMLGIQNFPKMM